MIKHSSANTAGTPPTNVGELAQLAVASTIVIRTVIKFPLALISHNCAIPECGWHGGCQSHSSRAWLESALRQDWQGPHYIHTVYGFVDDRWELSLIFHSKRYWKWDDSWNTSAVSTDGAASTHATLIRFMPTPNSEPTVSLHDTPLTRRLGDRCYRWIFFFYPIKARLDRGREE